MSRSAIQGPLTADMTQVADLVASLAAYGPRGCRPFAGPDAVGAALPDARFEITDAGDGEVNIWRTLPEGEEMDDYQAVAPEAGLIARLFHQWIHAAMAALRARDDEEHLRERAQSLVGLARARTGGDAAWGWGPQHPLHCELTLPHGSVLKRRYTGVTADAPTGWAWEDHGRLRYDDADALLDMALEGIIPATMAAPVIDADRREQLRRSALAAAVDQALERAGYGPAWERELLRTADDPAAGALPEDAYPVLLPMGEQWGIGLTGPAGAGRLDPEATGTMPVWTAAPAARAWIAAILGEDAAEKADLAGLDR